MKKKIALTAFVLLILAYPFIETSDFRLFMVNKAILHAILVSGLVFLTGFAGQISLGQAGFYGLGAYGTGLITTKLGMPVYVGVAGGVAISVAAGLLLSIPSFKLKAFFLSLVTISFGMVVWMTINNAIGLTGGPGGLFGIPQFQIGDMFFGDREYYYVFAFFLAAAVLCMYRIKHSYIGRSMFAINDDEVAAESCGISSKRSKTFAFGFASALAGLSGALYAHYAGFLTPEPFTFQESSNFVAMAVVGGLRDLGGGVIGGMALTFLPEFLKFEGWQTYYLLATAVIAIVFIVLKPSGLAPFVFRLLGKSFNLKRRTGQSLRFIKERKP